MINNISPSYLSDLVPQSVNSISHYNLRNADDLESVASRTNQYYNSFLPSVVREWNELTNDVRQSDSLHSFKCNINRERTTVPKHFYSGTRKAQILHTTVAVDTGINDIIVTGDFNYNMLTSQSSRKIEDLCRQFALFFFCVYFVCVIEILPTFRWLEKKLVSFFLSFFFFFFWFCISPFHCRTITEVFPNQKSTPY